MNKLTSLSIILSLLLCVACGEDEPTDAEALAMQISRGAAIYTQRCAGCHGTMGQGTDMGPPVVGAEAFPKEPRAGQVRDAEFMTAADVFAWAVVNMPATAPGSVTTEDMLAIFAFDLDANGVALDRPLDAALAQTIVLNE